MLRASSKLCFVDPNAGLEENPIQSSGTSRFSCWALTNSLFQAIYCINQLYLRNIHMINKLREFRSEKAHIKKQKGGSSLKTNLKPSSHTSVNLEPNAQASEQSNNVTENKRSVRDTLKAHLPNGQGYRQVILQLNHCLRQASSCPGQAARAGWLKGALEFKFFRALCCCCCFSLLMLLYSLKKNIRSLKEFLYLGKRILSQDPR